MDTTAKCVLYYNIIDQQLYNEDGEYMGNSPFNVFFDNVTSVELHYMTGTSSDNMDEWIPWTGLQGNTVGSSICFDDDYLHAKLGQVFEQCVAGTSQLKVSVALEQQDVNPSGVLLVYTVSGQSSSYPYTGYSYNSGIYTFQLESNVSESISTGTSVRVPQALLLKINSDEIDHSGASVGVFSFDINSMSHKLLNRLDYSNITRLDGMFEHQIYSDGKNIATFSFPMSVTNLIDYHGQANVPKDGTWADKAYVDSKIITKTSELQNDAGFISEETDPVYSADKPNIALKSELFSKNFFDLIDVPTTLSGYGITDAFIRDNKITLNGEQIQIKDTTAQDVKNFLGISEEIGSSIKYLNERGQFVPITSAVSVNGMLPDENGNINLSLYSIITLQELRRVTQTIKSVNDVQPVDGNITLTMNDFQISLEEGQPAITVQNLLIQLYENSGRSSVISVCNQTPDGSGNIQLQASDIDYSNTDYPTVGLALDNILDALSQMQPGSSGVLSVDGNTPDSNGDVQLRYSVNGTSDFLGNILNNFQGRIYQLQQNSGGSGGQVPQYSFQSPLKQSSGVVSIDLSNYARVTDIPSNVSAFNNDVGYITINDVPSVDLSPYALKSELFSKSFNDLTGKPTTLAGYGITDANISGRTITLGGNSIEVPESSGGGDYTLTKEAVDGVIGASVEGSTTKFYNEQGAFTEVDMSGYLPTTGGDMTGNIRFAPTDGDFVSVSSRSGTYNNAFHVGIDSGYGAHLIFYSNNYKNSEGTLYTELAGGFRLTAYKSGEGYQMGAPFGDGFATLEGTYNGLYWNDVLIATVNDITTHNEDTTAHADLLALKVDTETYNTAITAINTALEGKENTGVAQGLVDVHNESSTAHEALFEAKANKTELENYLPLSGGTMTGSLLTTNENSFMFENTTGKIGILFNSSQTNGASIWLHGKDHAQAGCFDINAHDGTASCQLKGKSDGTLKWTGGVLSGDGSGSGLSLYAGANNFDGATLQMFKRNHGTYAGQFYLRASTKSSSGDTTSGVKSCDLVGKPDGTLTWGGKNVLTTGNTTYVTAAWKSGRNWYIKWSNGLIQQGGRATITNGTATKVTFHTAFTSSNVSVVITTVKSTSSSYEAVVTGNTASNFTAHGWDTTINWIATGY